MRTISLDESKKIQVEIMQSIHEFCEQNGIKYSLCGGTLIGAMRHKGFIPWDDDIDIFMLRKDYDRFINTYKDERGIYKLHTLKNDPVYVYPFAKVDDTRTFVEEKVNSSKLGVFIDIFPVDNLDDMKDKSVKIIRSISFICTLHRAKLLNSYKPLSINKKIIVFFLKKFLILLPIRKLAYEIEARSQLGKCNSKYVACVVWGYKEKELLERKCFDKYILKEFEGHFFYVLQGYDRYLTNLYGDYMQLPPVHKRCSPHTISNIYWK